jgi:hypothetical protein
MTMKYVMLVYQGSTPLPSSPDDWAVLSEQEQQAVYADYAALNQNAAVEPGLPLGQPTDAKTVIVRNGKTVAHEGPFLGAMGSIGGFFVLEAESMDAAVELAARVPAARYGGAVEIRPAEKYW